MSFIAYHNLKNIGRRHYYFLRPPGSSRDPLEAAASSGSRMNPVEVAGIPWKQQAPPARDKGPPVRGRDPLEVAGTLQKRYGLPKSNREPLEVILTPWKRQGPPGSGRDPLKGAGTP